MRRSETLRLGLLVLGLAVVAASGCGDLSGSEHPLIEIQYRQIDELNKLTAAMKLVHDDASAEAQTPAIRDAFQNLIKIKRELPPLIRKHANDRLRKKTIDDMNTKLLRAEAASERAVDRVVSRSELPESFHSMLREEATRFLLATAEALNAMRNIPGVPALPDVGDPVLVRSLIELYEAHGPGKVVELSLVDMDGDTEQNLIEAAGEGATCLIFEGDETVAAVAPVDDFDAFCTRLAELGEVTERIDNRRELTLTVHREVPQPIVDRSKPSPIATDQPADAEQHLRDAMDELPAEARQQMRKAMAELNRHSPRTGGFRREAEPVDPGDYAKLAAMLTGDNPFDRKKAAERLLTVEVKDVSDSDLRKQIARGYRTMALEDTFNNEVAVKGLVHWGGKYSVPIVVELMDREKMSVDDHLFDALAELKQPEGAEAAAQRLGDFFNHDKAVASLREMGPVAEDSLIEVAPTNDAKTSLAAVELLGEVGTSKSYSLLRKAMKSTNRDVREAARRSLEMIRDRAKSPDADSPP